MNIARLIVTTLGIGAALLSGCSGQAPTATSPEATSKASAPPATSATPEAAPSYTLALPDRWKRAEGKVDTITGPDGLVTLKIVESGGSDLAKVIAAAWAKGSPQMGLTERQRVDGSPNDRFAKSLVITYSDDKNDRLAQAVALQHKDGKRVYVLLVEGPVKAVNKRGAELTRIITSLEVAGAKRVEVRAADAKELDAGKREKLFAFVEQARKATGLPGVAVALVTKEGTFARGFGTRGTGTSKPVDADTRFMIGSITKSFSTLLLATLVDEGKFDWDTPVKQVYPKFALADAKLSQEIQMQHLFCACVGAPRQDMELVFSFANERAADTMKEVSEMKLTTALGETFQYNNQLTAAGGFIAGQVVFPKERNLDRAYAKALRTRVLDKLGMQRSVVDLDAVRRGGNFAMSYRRDWKSGSQPNDLAIEQMVRPIAPAGAIWSTANDMAQYLRLQLGRGQIEGQPRLVSEKNLARTQTAQIAVSDKTGYGMGWLIGKYRGIDAVKHSGGSMGFASHLAFFPELGMGLFVVANRNATGGLSGLVQRKLFELLFDALEPRAERNLKDNLAKIDKLLAKQASHVTVEPIPAELFGRYRSQRLGDMSIVKRAGGALLDVGEWQGNLAVFDPKERADTLVITSGPLQGLTLFFEKRDGKQVLVLKHSQTDYVAVRQ